jgi:uncharacterized glyoxalase superfamily protein PhnB
VFAHHRVLLSLVAAAVATAAGVASPPSRNFAMTTATTTPAVLSLAPVILVDAVEPCIAFWINRLGFIKENEVPGPDGKLIFASVKKGNVEIMYQTRASAMEANPRVAERGGDAVALFITVSSIADLDAIEAQVKDAPVVKARHDTFYGTTEFYVREPGGTVVGFAAHK